MLFERFRLENGIRTIIVPYHETKAITLLALFRVGSRFENKRILGISHFLEHMMFKGTKKRPKTIDISRELDGVGAEYNAFTSKDHTGYYIKLNYEHTKLAMDIMYDMLANSLIKSEEIEKERNVILEEINMYEDNPLMLIEELFEEELYSGNSLGSRIAGDESSLRNINRKEIVSFFKEYYRPAEMVFAAAGQIPENFNKLLERTFSNKLKQDGRPKQPKKFNLAALHNKGPRLKLKYKDTGQVQLVLGFPSYEFLNPKLPTLTVLANILGGTMSSRLFIAVREKRGLAYAVRAGINVYEDTGNLMIQAGLDKSRIDEAIRVIMEEVKRVVKEGVKQEEVDWAKENIRGRLALALEDSSDTADFFAKQELHSGEVLSPEEKLEQIFAVTRGDIKKVAEDILKPRRLAAAIIGPFEDKKRFEKLMRFL